MVGVVLFYSEDEISEFFFSENEGVFIRENVL